MRIQGVGIERVAKAKGPRQFWRDLPRVLRVKVEIQKVERLVAGMGKVSVAVEATP